MRIDSQKKQETILFVSDSNYTRVFAPLPAVLMMLCQSSSQEALSRWRSDFFAASSVLSTRCYLAFMDGERNNEAKVRLGQPENCMYHFFRNGHHVEKVDLDRSTDSIVKYSSSKTGIPFHTIEDDADAADFIESKPRSLVYYASNTSQETVRKVYAIANELRDFIPVGFCPDPDIADFLGITIFPSLYLHKGKKQFRYNLEIKGAIGESIRQWINKVTKPSIPVYDFKEVDNYKNGPPVAIIFTKEDSEEETLKVGEQLQAKFKDKLKFTQIDAVNGLRLMTGIGFSRFAGPAFAIVNYSHPSALAYLFDEDEDMEFKLLARFIFDFLGGKLDPVLKSAPPPIKNDGVVHEYVASDVKEFLNHQAKVKLILFYHPWDTAWIKVYRKAADSFKDFFFSRIDISANDVIGFPILSNYPAIVAFVDGKHFTYEGKMKLLKFDKFIKSLTPNDDL